MFKIWAKVITDGNIETQLVYERDEKLVYSQFFTYLADICSGLDISTPILLKSHIFNFAKFNTVRFIARDFAEPVPFDRLVLDRIVV